MLKITTEKKIYNVYIGKIWFIIDGVWHQCYCNIM